MVVLIRYFLLFLALFVSLSLSSSSPSSLAVKYVNKTTGDVAYSFLPALYSTLGKGVYVATPLNVVVMDDANCDMNVSVVQDSVLVFVGKTIPMFQKCNTTPQANSAIFARVAQKHGASALLLHNKDQLSDGRVIGFTSHITIPVLVMPDETLDFFRSSDLDFSTALLPTLHASEAHVINRLRNWWLAWKAGTSILYGLLLLLVSHLFYTDLLKLRKRKIITNSLIMKGIAVYGCIVSLLWTTVDPFGFDGIIPWKNTILINLHFSASIIVFTLLLLMWNQAVGRMNFSSKTIIAYIFYAICVIVFLVSLVFGSLWWSVVTNDIFSRGITVLFVLIAVGFCVVGKNMLQVLYAGRNLRGNNYRLLAKIAVFIAWYLSICLGVAITYSSGVLGRIFELMLTILFEALCLGGTFVVLFFQPFKQHRPKSSQVQTVTGRLAETPSQTRLTQVRSSESPSQTQSPVSSDLTSGLGTITKDESYSYTYTYADSESHLSRNYATFSHANA